LWGTLPRVFDRACEYYSERTAIIDGDRRLSYAEMQTWSNRIALALKTAGVLKGMRVGLLMPNCLEFIPAMHGIWKAGAAIVQMAARSTVSDLIFFLKSSNASALIYHAKFDEHIAEIRHQLPSIQRFICVESAGITTSKTESLRPALSGRWQELDFSEIVTHGLSSGEVSDVEASDAAFIAFTSGTTGRPKGVVQNHETWSHYSITAGLEIGDIRPGEIFVHGGALTHFTQSFVMPTFLRGGINVILPSLDPGVLLDAIEREQATAMATVPTALNTLLDHAEQTEGQLSSLRTVVYAGSPMSPSSLQRAIKVLGQIFVQTYAGTEQGYVTYLAREDHEPASPRLASAGRPLFQVEVSIRDAEGTPLPQGALGEVWTKQKGQMLRYADVDIERQRRGSTWVQTGDVGYLDESGYLYLVDRLKDMIVTGGINVFPRQIETILEDHPAITQCAVIGVPDPKWGEAVKALVVRQDKTQVSAQELQELVKQQKGSVWAPKSVEFVPSLPLTPSGKVDKKTIRAPYWEGLDRQIN